MRLNALVSGKPPPVAIAVSLAALLLTACSRPDGGAGDKAASANGPAAATAPPAPASVDAAASPTVGGDGSPILLTPLSPTDLAEAKLAGELGCGFVASGTSPILVAMGNVASPDPAWGVVKIGGYVERVAAPGGFDAMLKGVTFSGAGKTVRIDLTGPATAGGESPPRPATLTYDRADGAKLTVAGRWTCGP